MHVQTIPMFQDNYAYLLSDDKTKDAFVIDPASSREVIPLLAKLTSAGSINFKGILSTHHHADHTAGNEDLLEALGTSSPLEVYGGSHLVPGRTITPAHGATFKLGSGVTVTALHTPCHTQDSICYLAEDGDQRAVFTGDTLFIAGCGRFFEGTASEMHKALNQVLAALPDNTKVYPGHEYTASNVRFCLSVSQSEPIKKLASFTSQHRQTPGTSTIADEKLHNVFMRVTDPAIQKATQRADPVGVMGQLRYMKNNA